MTLKNRLIQGAAVLALAAVAQAQAQEVVLKVHHIWPTVAMGHQRVVVPWCEAIAKDSNNRMRCQILPAMTGGKSATCMGGWQWAMNAFSKNKDAAGNMIKFLSSKEASAFIAREGSILPVFQSVYRDPEVNKAVPWFQSALPVVLGAQSRPMVEDYGQVSDIIRTTTSAILARTKTPEAGVDEIAARVGRLMR